MRVFFGRIIQNFGRFRHSPIPTNTHTDKATLTLLAGVLPYYTIPSRLARLTFGLFFGGNIIISQLSFLALL